LLFWGCRTTGLLELLEEADGFYVAAGFLPGSALPDGVSLGDSVVVGSTSGLSLAFLPGNPLGLGFYSCSLKVDGSKLRLGSSFSLGRKAHSSLASSHAWS